MLADVFTPVGIYLRLRDRFRDTILLESTDHHVAENSYSFICINAIAGIEIIDQRHIEFKLPGQPPQREAISDPARVPQLLQDFLSRFQGDEHPPSAGAFARGLFGYTTFDAIRFFDKAFDVPVGKNDLNPAGAIPPIRYRFYQYVIAINHFKDELELAENIAPGIDSEIEVIESLIQGKDVPVYPFSTNGGESSNMSDEQFLAMVEKGIEGCHRGDVFQVVLSRRFDQPFRGDEFNVYRALRSVNPSPYLFYFDYGDYKLLGSSPEAQVVISNGKALLHPIAGTFRRTGNDETDHLAAELLLSDRKENAEHVMLVDLARNDLSRVCDDVTVSRMKEIQYYSHVIHMVSEVQGRMRKNANPFEVMAKTFPAGTLSGAPKVRAIQLIHEFEPTPRGYYGGAIGFMGFDGKCNHAIMIRSFLSMNNTLTCQAGAGVVAASEPRKELEEVKNKLDALKKAIRLAETLNRKSTNE